MKDRSLFSYESTKSRSAAYAGVNNAVPEVECGKWNFRRQANIYSTKS